MINSGYVFGVQVSYYCSSSQSSATQVSGYYYANNWQASGLAKTTQFKVRAIRSFAPPSLPTVTTNPTITNIGAATAVSGISTNTELACRAYVIAAQPRFALGQLLSTPGALALMQQNEVDPLTLLQRHVHGDWGVICPDDAQANEAALQYGDRVLSSYLLPSGGVIWVITEGDRSMTTCLRPDEY